MRLGHRWPMVSRRNVNSRSKCALHRACSHSSCQYGFHQSCTSTATRLGRMPCSRIASMPRLSCTPYQVQMSLATVCSQCRREATRRERVFFAKPSLDGGLLELWLSLDRRDSNSSTRNVNCRTFSINGKSMRIKAVLLLATQARKIRQFFPASKHTAQCIKVQSLQAE